MSKKNKRIFYVYILRRPDNHDPFYTWLSCPFYVGKGNGKRMESHRSQAKRLFDSKDIDIRLKIIYKLWKDGLDFEEEILFDNLTEQEAFEIERQLIAKYGRIDKGTGCLANMTDGGEGMSGWIAPDESKRKISEARKGIVFSDEHIENLRKSHTGYIAPLEQRKNMSRSQKERREKTKTGAEQECAFCNEPFYRVKSSDKIFCSRECYLNFVRLVNSKDYTEELGELSRFVLIGKKSSEEARKNISLGWIERKKKKVYLTEVPRVCENKNCEKVFKSANPNQKFCSHPCSVEAKKKEDQICEQCGKSFHAKGTKLKYCSQECYFIEMRKGKEIKDKTCEFCGKTFMPLNKNQMKNRKFCSKKCSDKFLKGVPKKKKASILSTPLILMHTDMHMPLQFDKAVNE